MGCARRRLGVARRDVRDGWPAGCAAARADRRRHCRGQQRWPDSCPAPAGVCLADYCRLPCGTGHQGRHRAHLSQGLAAVPERGDGHHRHEHGHWSGPDPPEGGAGDDGRVGHGAGWSLGDDADGRCLWRRCPIGGVHAVHACPAGCGHGVCRCAALGRRVRYGHARRALVSRPGLAGLRGNTADSGLGRRRARLADSGGRPASTNGCGCSARGDGAGQDHAAAMAARDQLCIPGMEHRAGVHARDPHARLARVAPGVAREPLPDCGVRRPGLRTGSRGRYRSADSISRYKPGRHGFGRDHRRCEQRRSILRNGAADLAACDRADRGAAACTVHRPATDVTGRPMEDAALCRLRQKSAMRPTQDRLPA